MADSKPLVISVQPNSVPTGGPNEWRNMTAQIHIFTRDIITPDITSDADVSSMISGIPTVFARANMFGTALSYSSSLKGTTNALNQYYLGLVDEWRGAIACIALDSNAIDVRAIKLGYTDGKDYKDTANIYEPKGAFGNMLFERRQVWCSQKASQNEKVVPFINVIKINGKVVAGTSPDTLLFTSANYHLTPGKPYVDVATGKFTDPQKSNLSAEQWLSLYAYVDNLIKKIPALANYYTPVGKSKSLVDYSNVSQNLQVWLNEIKENILKKGYDLEKASALPVNSFKEPFDRIFNFTDELFGLNGVISQVNESGLSICFNPEKLLLEKNAEIARIPLTSDYSRNPDKLSDLSIYVLKASRLGKDGYAFFALPLSELGIKVFGQNIGVLLGQDKTGTSIKSQLKASYDEQNNTLDVKLSIITDDNKTKAIDVTYKVRPEMVYKKDLVLWPNFISKQWNRYFLYSEIPHNVHSEDCPFRAVPFVGDEADPFFNVIRDEDDKFMYLAENGQIIENDKTDAKLHIVADHRVADSKYQYEIYESSHPFKGVKLTTTTKDSGYILIRYAREAGKRMPWNRLEESRELRDAHLGIDFGSTNTSVAYYDTVKREDPKGITFTDLRVSLLCDMHGNENPITTENSLFFFQGQTLRSNAIKSILALQDFKRFPTNASQEYLRKKEVSGGFPCFCKNLPVTSIQEDKINVEFINGTGTNATLVHNMKWSDQESDKAHKTAFLSSLLLQIYAQLFTNDVVPVKLKWSYPSAMGDSLVKDYDQIWSNLNSICPVKDHNGVKKPLNVTEWHARKVIIDDTEGAWGSEVSSNPWDASGNAWGTDASTASENRGTNSDSADGWGASSVSADGWGASSGSGDGWNDAPVGNDGWEPTNIKAKPVDLKPDGGPIKFNFIDVNQESCLTEACAVANYMSNDKNIFVDGQHLVLCFDVGGSTTDISALCTMKDKKGQLRNAMIKQNSIRFAAQRISNATKSIPTFKKVLDAICEKHKIRILGLNMGPNTYSQKTAPYFYEQIVDNLNTDQLVDLYKCISAYSPELFCINLYVTGLIMYYAGQLSNKLIQEVRRSEDGPGENWRPQVQIVFAGKGSRIFEWFSCTNFDRAKAYSNEMFIHGFGGMAQAQKLLYGPPAIDLSSKSSPDNKFEVSKGLAMSSLQAAGGGLVVPEEDKAIEILGEEGFSLKTIDGTIVSLPYDNSITCEFMEHIGNYFMGPVDGTGEMTCKKFMDFTNVFFTYAKKLYNLDRKMGQTDFINGFKNMNINGYIQALPEYRKAVQDKGPENKFDFVAPIIILEGMKFYDEVLLPKLQ